MADFDIQSIAELLELLDIDVFQLILPCLFCNNVMSICDCLHFEKAPLTLAWRDGQPYGCCQLCCLKAGLLEYELFFQFAIPAACIEQIAGPLLTLDVRCVLCLTTLNLGDKLALQWNNQNYLLIRDRLKGVCTPCQNAWVYSYYTRHSA